MNTLFFRTSGVLLLSTILAGLCLCLPSGAADSSIAVASDEIRTSSSGKKDSITPLTPGSPVDSRLSSGRTDRYSIKLAAGEFARVDLCSKGADLLAVATGPNDKESGRWHISRDISQPVAWIADLAGFYTLQLSVLKGRYTDQAYRIQAISREMPSLQDRKQVAACQTLSSAVRLNREFDIVSRLAALRKYQEAAEAWRLIGDQPVQASTLYQIGNAYRDMSEYLKGTGAYHQAFSFAGDPSARARILNAIGNIYLRRGNRSKAMGYITEALKIGRSAGDPWSESQSLYNLGYASYIESRNQEAQQYLLKVLSICEPLHDSFRIARTHLILGYTYHAQKDMKRAQRHYERSLLYGRETEEKAIEADALLALGHLKITVGEWQQAFGFYDAAMGFFKKMADRTSQNSILQGKAYGYRAMGSAQRALDMYLRSAAISRELNDTYMECHTHTQISELYQEMGAYDKAIQHCRLALQVNREAPSVYIEASVLEVMGRVYEKQNETAKSRDHYRRALDLYRKAEDKFRQGLLLNSIGNSYRAAGELPLAFEYFREALSLQQTSGDVLNKTATLYNLARTRSAAGDLSAALTDLNEALRSTESLRVKVASQEFRASYAASVNGIYKYAIELLMRLNQAQPGAGWAAEALRASERARARSLLESLAETRADIRQGVDPALLQREQSLQQALNLKAEAQMNLLSAKHTIQQAAELSKGIDDLTTQYHEVQALIRSRSPHYASLTQPQPLALEEIQHGLLDADTMLLEYALGAERSYLWAVTQTSLISYELPARSVIEKAARRVRDLMLAFQPRPREKAREYRMRILDFERSYPAESAALSQMLLGEALHQTGKRRLLIVTEGALQYLPFGALPAPQECARDAGAGNEAVPLLHHYEIISLPSASVLAALRRETRDRPTPPKMIAIFADPVFDKDDPRVHKKPPRTAKTATRTGPSRAAVPAFQSNGALDSPAAIASSPPQATGTEAGLRRDGASLSRLPSTRLEAEAIQSLIPETQCFKALDFAANRSTATGALLSQYRVIHFATHGLLDSEHPELSALALSLVDEQGRPQNGFLRLSDIYNLNLPADLVVLSACDSGLGKEVLGEGLVGIVRGFMYAGAPRVVASLWKVEDEATAALMKCFYQHMFEKGEPAAAALRGAQIEISQKKRWKDPYFWAAFVLQGEWK